MGNIIALRSIVKTILNDNCIDPYPTDMIRRGLHFFDESDNINFSRGNTFPKGYIQHAPGGVTTKSNLGRTGWSKQTGTLDVFYYVKEKQSYTTGSDTYKNQDLVSYMLKQIRTALLDNNASGSDYHMFPEAFGTAQEPQLQDIGGSKFWVGIQPITYYWGEKYGNAN